jgi:hypothetical protein
MNRLTFLRPQYSAVAPMARWGSGFPIVARLRRELLKEFACSVSSALRDGNAAEPRARNPQSNLPLSHPASLPPPLPGSHAAGLVPPGRPHPIRRGLSAHPPRRLGDPRHQTPRSDAAVRAPIEQTHCW